MHLEVSIKQLQCATCTKTNTVRVCPERYPVLCFSMIRHPDDIVNVRLLQADILDGCLLPDLINQLCRRDLPLEEPVHGACTLLPDNLRSGMLHILLRVKVNDEFPVRGNPFHQFIQGAIFDDDP